MSTIPTREESEILVSLPLGINRDGAKFAFAQQSDHTLRAWTLLIGRSTTSGQETNLSTEESGELRTVPLIHDGTNLVRILGESGRQVAVSLWGWDGASLIRLLTNDSGQLYSEPYEHWLDVPPVELTAGDAILWNPGAGATDLFLVEIEVYAFTAVAAAITLYVDLASGGTPSNPEYIMNAEILAAKARLPHVRLIKGTDDIRGFSTAGSDANVHFRARQVKRT